jgi:hypothetical protein
VLFIIRPDIPIRGIPLLITKSIRENDNRGDVEAYVRQKLSTSKPKFQKWYPKDAPEPVEFLVRGSNGLFLWVSTVLHQLSTANTKSKFKSYFDSLGKSSGNMDALYRGILDRIGDEEKRWVFEILRWVIAAETPLSINQLEGLVQWSLDDERENFKEFLEDECGSFVRVVPGREGAQVVQPTHETFRSFLPDPMKCPEKFFFDEEKAHHDVALKWCANSRPICGKNLGPSSL